MFSGSRKYTVTVPTTAVKDLEGNPPLAVGSSIWYSASTPSDTVGASVRTEAGAYTPANGATGVAQNTNIVLYFNEDIQGGWGNMYFCLNSDAVDNTTCDYGKFSDNTTVSVDMSASQFAWRRVMTINPTKSLKIGQKLYVMMPGESVYDASYAMNGMSKIMGSDYSFTVVSQDTVSPHVDCWTTPTLSTGSVVVTFSEAVQGTGTVFTDKLAPTASTNEAVASSTISGNTVTFTKAWATGSKYTLKIPSGQFTDLASNANVALPTKEITFTIQSDGTPPTATMVPSRLTTAADPYDVLTLVFSEVVLAGTGTVSVNAGTSTANTMDIMSFVKSNSLTSVLSAPTTLPTCGNTFTFKVNADAFSDAAQNAFTQFSSFVTGTRSNLRDTNVPQVIGVDLGGVGSPNPAFSASSLAIYFTEAVQLGSTTGARAYLAGSYGGSLIAGQGFCYLNGSCAAGATCNQACSYSNSTTTAVTLTGFTFSGAKVTVGGFSPSLEVGKGYKLMIDQGRFADLAGNTNEVLDGETGTIGAFVLQAATSSTTATTTAAPTDVTGPVFWATEPGDGELMVAPSTTVQVVFNEVVQAGTGDINIGGTSVAVSGCCFNQNVMTCKPASSLALDTTYSVSYAASAIKDAVGNTASNFIDGSTNTMVFTTINIDYTPGTTTFTTGTWLDPPHGQNNVPKSTALALSFTATVQAGAGSVTLSRTGETLTVASMYFAGSTVYLAPPRLTESASYTVSVAAGAFRTTAGANVAAFSYSFTVAVDDIQAPVAQVKVPKHSSTDQSPSADIMLYFSEGVQVAGAGFMVTVSDGVTVNRIPVDNSNPFAGQVSILEPGSIALIDPFDDMGYTKTVTVGADTGAFYDYFGNTFALGAYSYQTVGSGWWLRKNNNASAGFGPRTGAVCYTTSSGMMIYGGKAGTCLSDLWSTTTGGTWTKVADQATTTTGADAPKAANAPTAIDANGCIWLLGGECNDDSSTIWKTCDAGSTWEAMPSPTPVAFNAIGPSWPTTWSNHAIAIVGGWQLVIVKAAEGEEGGVWRFLDSTLVVQKVASAPLPFESRMDPTLLATSDSKLYLLGGHMCTDMACSNNMVFSDLWSSADVGETWAAHTMGIFANQDLATRVTEYSKGIGRYYSTVMTGDDTIYVLAGHKPNTTQGLNSVFTAYTNPPDVTFSSTTYLQGPTQTVLKTMPKVAIFFKENIQMGAGTIQFKAGASALAVTTQIFRQGIHLYPSAALTAGTTYNLEMPAGSVKDAAGNPLGSLSPAYSFTVNGDTDAPTVVSSYPADLATNVAPATTLRLTMSEPVHPGTGSLALTPLVGTPYVADVSSAVIRSREVTAGSMVYDVFFPATSLTLGAVYTIQVPAGMLKDIAGNDIAAANVASFTVLSGAPPASNPYTALTFTPGSAGTGNATLDVTAPTFVSMLPKNGATDVEATSGNAVVMYFSEPVKFNASGIISIKNSTNHEVGKVNLTSDAVAIAPGWNATKIPIPAVLVKGQKFTVSIPAGVITDFAGNNLAAITKSFTCLAETADTVAPVATGMSINPTMANMLDVYFSEDIMKGSVGTVAVFGSGVNIQTPIAHSNVTVSGSKLSVSVYAGSLDTAGLYDMRVGAGALKDAAGNLFLGLNDSSMTYVTSNLDVTAPTLVNKLPVHESSLGFTLPVSASMMLEFSENIQAAAPGVTAVTLTPKFGYQAITVDTVDLYIDERSVALTPGTLMPGEAYSVAVHSNAFMDAAGNYYGGLASGYTISTTASMGFTEVSTNNWNDAAYFDGSRYGSCGLVDANNVLYIIGGANGTAGASPSGMMNDVYYYESKRESSCSASLVPYTCPADACTDASTLATVSVSRTVWKAPTASGAPCTSSSGVDARDLWSEVEISSEACSCPLCLAPPGGTLPTHMTNETYVSMYTLVSAASGTAPLECAPGKLPNGSFTCVVDTPYIGKFATPYPNCYPAPCTAPPNTAGISKFEALTMATSTGGMNCSALSSTNTMISGGVCGVTCSTGFTQGKGFECFEGTFFDAVCIPLTPCSQSDVSVTNGAIECAAGTTAEYSNTCSITCDTEGGYSPYIPAAVATCDVSDSGVMSFTAPMGMTLDEVCVPTTCMPPKDPSNGVFTKSGTSINAVWGLSCNSGYMVDMAVAVNTMCQTSGAITTPLPVCMDAPGCDGTTFPVTTIPNAETTDCGPDMKDGEQCSVVCMDTFQSVGKLTCSAGTFVGIANCFEAGMDLSLIQEVEMMSSAIGIAMDLSSVSDTVAQAALTAALAAGLGVSSNDLPTVAVSMGSRRLAAGKGSLRRLQSAGYEVAYQAIVPDNSDPGALAAKASAVGAPGATQDAFVGGFPDTIEVDQSSLKVTQAPRTFSATILRDPNGGAYAPAPPPMPVLPTPPPTPPATPPPTPPSSSGTGTGGSSSTTKEEDDNTGAIIGGVVGGVIALALIGGLAYYFLVVKAKKQSE
jgi:hypothetical protein